MTGDVYLDASSVKNMTITFDAADVGGALWDEGIWDEASWSGEAGNIVSRRINRTARSFGIRYKNGAPNTHVALLDMSVLSTRTSTKL